MLKSKFNKIVASSLLLLTTLSQAAGFKLDQWYRIKPIGHEDHCYDVCGASDDDCTKVIVYQKCDESKNQHFKFKRVRNRNTFYIVPRHAHWKVLDISEGSEDNGAGLILYQQINWGRHENQEFFINRIGGDYYRITNVKSGLSLGFDEHLNICQYLDFSGNTMVKLEEVDH